MAFSIPRRCTDSNTSIHLRIHVTLRKFITEASLIQRLRLEPYAMDPQPVMPSRSDWTCTGMPLSLLEPSTQARDSHSETFTFTAGLVPAASRTVSHFGLTKGNKDLTDLITLASTLTLIHTYSQILALHQQTRSTFSNARRRHHHRFPTTDV